MKVTVTPETTEVPKQTITLEMDVEEFALLRRVVRHHCDGLSRARTALEKGIEQATKLLHPHWAAKVAAVGTWRADFTRRGMHAEVVHEEFSK